MRVFLGWNRLFLNTNVPHARFPTAFEEFRYRRAEAGPPVVEKPLPDFKNPNTFANVGIPTHAVAETFLGMGEESEQ